MRRPSSRPLTEHQRRSGFALTGALVLGAAIAIGAFSTPERTPHRTTDAHRGVPDSPPRIADATSVTSTSPSHAVADPTQMSATGNQPTVRDEQIIERQARTFLSAYLAYEVGTLDGTARKQLLASATAALAHRLIHHPVDLPPRDRPSAGEVRSLALNGGGAHTPLKVNATIEQAGWASGLTLQFEHANGRWLVSRVT